MTLEIYRRILPCVAKLKPEIRILAKKMIARMEEIYPDAAIVFLSYWNRSGEEDAYSIIHGDDMIAERCFLELEQKMRRMERCNLNPSDQSLKELGSMIDELSEEGDPELIAIFKKVYDLLVIQNGDPKTAPFFGEAIVMVGWMELGIHYHRYIEFVGMMRGIVSLFNAGIDSFRRLYRREEGQL